MTRAGTYNAVFLTTELLENVLHHLPATQLLLVQRVCRKWRGVIHQNGLLQEYLFLKASPKTVAWKWSDGPGRYRLTRLDKVPNSEPRYEDSIALTARLNDMMLYNPHRHETTTAENSPGEVFEFKEEARWRLKPGSWRQMFVTQPPAVDVYAEYILGNFEKSRSGYDGDNQDFYRPDGVTLGDLVDHGLKLEAEGNKVNWDRCWFQACCRVFTSKEEAKMKSIT